MARVENLEVLIQANADQLKSELLATQNALKKFEKNTSKTSNITKTSFGGIATASTAMKLGIASAVGAGLVALSGLAIAGTKSAMQVIESENLVAVTFGNMTSDIVKWSDTLQQKLGLNAFEVRKQAGIFFNIANSMGVASDNALVLSKGLTSLAYDMASFYNLATDDAILKLQAGLTGETEPLKRLGIVVDETTVKQTAYRLGIAQTGVELDNNQKILARYMTIMEQTKNAQQDLARTVDSPANQMRIFQANLQYLTTTIGSFFIPVLNKVLPYLNAMAILAGKALHSLLALFGIAGIKPAENTTANISNNIGSISSNLDSARGSANGLKKELLGLAGFDEMNVLSTDRGGAGGAGGTGAGGIGGGDFKLHDYDMGLDNVKSKTDEIINSIKAGWSGLANWFKNLPILQPIIESAKSLWGEVIKLTSELSRMWEIGRGTEILTSIFTGLGNVLSTVVGGAIWLFMEGWKMNFTIINWVIDSVKTLIFNIALLAIRFKNFFNDAVSGFNIVRNAVLGVFSSPQSIINSFFNIISARIDSMKTIFGSLGVTIANLIKMPMNAVIRGLNTAFGLIRGVKIPDWVPNAGGKSFNPPSIPYLAEGGVVTNPTMAMIGEGGYKEAVLPLDRNTEWAKEVANLISSNGGNGQINLTVQIGSKTVGKEIIDIINDESMRGNNLVLKI